MTRGTRLKRAFLNAPRVTVQNHKAVEGRPFKLDCQKPEGYPKPTISWKTQEDGSDKREDFLNRRITPSPEGTLWFSNVTKEDANPKSRYICVAKSSAFEEEVTLAEHYINELEADSKPNDGELVPQYVSNNMVAKVGDDTMIWYWYKDGKDVNGKPGDRVTRHNRSACRRLLIKDTRAEDAGSYKCVADNGRGKPAEHTVKLTVKPEKQTLAKEGQDITIPCQVSGSINPFTTFVYNAQELKTSARVSTGPEGISIKKVQKSDGGVPTGPYYWATTWTTGPYYWSTTWTTGPYYWSTTWTTGIQ
ncbi:Hemolin [Operophtera brumata]|uniref:Hemolin n=1 Tax=Operophtera brumata TaxID=104452 RepID=A0A0L7KXA8_OPEBR|nr:Hemolin [Operophtera brumata]